MILDKIADYTTNLLSYDETKVIISRENATQKTFSDNYIVIDTLSPANPIGSTRMYDYENEKETFITLFNAKITLEFYGSNGYDNAYKFINLQNSQLARDLQRTYEITLFKDLTINNLKQVVGNRYFNRFEIEITVQYNIITIIDTLRVESIPVEYIKD